MDDALRAAARDLTDEVAEQADAWDVEGDLPVELLRSLGKRGLLCAEVPVEYGGLGASCVDSGEFTAFVGSLCSSVRSIMTSQGMAAWTVRRMGRPEQQERFLRDMTSGSLAAVAFSEPDAGSDLSAIGTEIRPDGDDVVVHGRKKWITASAHADLLVVVGRHGAGGAAVVVPTSAPGVHVSRIPNTLGCRAAGHADIELDSVRVPASNVLGGASLPITMLVTTALAYGRYSVAWGCVGILRACLDAAARHATRREQFGSPLAEHQLVTRHLASLLVSEQIARRACEHAGRCRDEGSPDQVVATLLAKHVSAEQAAAGASRAVQVLASAAGRDGTVVARAYRDAKLMEIIEGSNEICELTLGRHAASQAS